MKITKQGVDPKTKIYTAKCENCKSEYEYTIQDPEIKTEQGDIRDPRESSYKYFDCQICKARVIINTH